MLRKRCQQCALFQMDLQHVSVLAFVTVVQNLQQLFKAISKCNSMMCSYLILAYLNCIIHNSVRILGSLKYAYWDSAIWTQIMWNSIFQTREFVWMLLIWVLAHFTHCMWQMPTVLLVRERNGINLLMLLIKKRDESEVQLQCCVMRAVGVFLSVLITTQPSLDPLMTVASWDPWVTAAAAGH